MGMNREDAVNYLQDRGKIRNAKKVQPKFNANEERKIAKVMKQGKIYGDPIVELY